MALPKEPRQKMINIMYLVLTALLALNVASEILNAFDTINTSLNNANVIIGKGNDDVYKSLKRLADSSSTNKEQALIWLPKAEKARTLSEAIYNEVESLKLELKKAAGLTLVDGKEVFLKEDLESPTRILVEKPDGGKGISRGELLLNKLTKFKQDLAAIDPKINAEIIPKLPLNLNIPDASEEGVPKDWSYRYFHMTPSIAAITILTKFQNDIKNCEAMIASYCHQQVGQTQVPIDQFPAIAYSNSQYLKSGDELVITAGIGGFSSAAKPTITIDGAVVPIGPDGTAIYKSTANNVGENSKRVRISFTKPNGQTAVVEKDVKFTVGISSGLTIATPKTTIFYKGLDNELVVNSSGDASKISVSAASGGVSIKPIGAGKYIVNPSQLGNAIINVNDGKTSTQISIPVKRIPDPTPKVGGTENGNMELGTFQNSLGVSTVLKDFLIDGVRPIVKSFTIVFTGAGFPKLVSVQNYGAEFNSTVKSLMNKCMSETNVIIGDIEIIEPGGGTRTINPQISLILD